MIGFYDYTVIVTYLSLIISVFGMTRAIGGDFTTAIVCLALSGLCDMFDGKIARTKKNRTEDEKCFGIQIDSLCDVICFGVFPALICYRMGVNGVLGGVIIAMYCTCSVIRLAYFNVLEARRQREESGLMKYYHGLPITSMSIVLPILYFVQKMFIQNNGTTFTILLHVALAMVGMLFVIDFRVRKPSNKELGIIVAVVAIALMFVLAKTVQYKKVEMAGNVGNHVINTEDSSRLDDTGKENRIIRVLGWKR